MTFEKLQKDMIAAMKAHDKPRKEAISSLVSASKEIAINEGKRDDISEEIVNRAILKELHASEEQIASCPKDRTELIAEYKFRYDVISGYAPKMMSAEEIEGFLKENYADLLAAKNKGMIMKNVMPALKGKADGKEISKVVANLLQ